MTKSELIEQVSEMLKLPTGKAEQIVNCIFDSMVKALQDGDGIEIRGLGSFTVREYKSYEGRNPRTGDTVHVAPKRLPFFKVGKDLRDRVNGSIEAQSKGDGAAAAQNGASGSAGGSANGSANGSERPEGNGSQGAGSRMATPSNGARDSKPMSGMAAAAHADARLGSSSDWE